MYYVRIVMFVLSWAIGASAIAAPTPAPARGASSVAVAPAAQAELRLNYAVYGTETSLVGKLKAVLSERFRKAGVHITDRFPSATLVLYVMRDVDSNINKSGVTVAVAYVSNAQTDRFAANLIKKQGGPLPEMLVAMLRQDGFLYHLSAAHLDNSSAKELNTFSAAIVSAFLQKVGARG